MRRRTNYSKNFSIEFALRFFVMHRFKILVFLGGLVLLSVLSFISFLATPPRTFVSNTIFTVEEGSTLSHIAMTLKTHHYIRSEIMFKILTTTIFADGNDAVAGDYNFEKPITVFTVAQRIVSGDFDLTPIKVTVPEGLNKFELAELLRTKIPNFDSEKFVSAAPEGYLFPDTYFFPPNVTSEKIIKIMQDNFYKKIATVQQGIANFGQPLEDVIKMASIIETEARQFETRQIISDILWKRIETGMPLQVDVSFKYVNGKTTAQLTHADLAIDSPYNSYRYEGLPPTPIANPGLDSILAAITPKDTKYLFFLSDAHGTMHYAATFEEHKKNKALYIQ